MTAGTNHDGHQLIASALPTPRCRLQPRCSKALGMLSALVLTLLPFTTSCADTIANPRALSTATTWLVGPTRKLQTPSAAAKLAQSGDTIEIDAGTYLNDYAEWRQENLTLRGVGGLAHLQSNVLIPNGKAIWIVSGNNTLIENMEFSGARVVDTNGAGIRHEGGDLTLRNTYFHHNEFSVLTGAHPEASLDVQSSRFWFQKREGTFSHGIYVGELKRFTLVGSHIKGTDRGHQVKSRALENHILYNRIEDVAGGSSSRLVDLSNCGLSYIIGNDMLQANTSQNLNAIGYGPEGCDGRSARQQRLFVVNNTFVNEAMNSTLVRNHANEDALVANNLVFGRTTFLQGKGVKQNNVALDIDLWRSNKNQDIHQSAPDRWYPPPDSAAVHAALPLPDREGESLVPIRMFAPPQGTVPRLTHGALNIGSREPASDAAQNPPAR